MSNKSPLEIVNDQFGGKDKLVDTLVGLLAGDEPKDELRKRLLSVSNRKLLRLQRVATTVQEKYGSREKLVEQAAGTRGKDKDFVTRLGSYSTARLVDIARTGERHARAAATATKRAADRKQARPPADPAAKQG